MAKSPGRKSSQTSKKKLDALAKRVEALEDQSFAQRMLIDELEKQLEVAEKAIKDVKENSFNFSWPPQQPYQQHAHACSPGPMDMFGNVTCSTCGSLMWTITTTCGSGTYGDTSGTYSVDDIDITWSDSDELTKKE